ncbi:MAG: hypothetical protein R8M37_00900 [Alphaproteobacteria bacterium]|nr:hypothetical protein [Alphaproteobacteria bacterium]
MARKSPALQRIFNEYVQHITDSIVKSDKPGIGVSYMTRKDNWMEKVPHSNNMERFLISETKLFLNTMDNLDSLSTDPTFLKVLVKEIVKYLAPYFAKGNKLSVANASIFLHKELWEKNWHIRGLLFNLEKKRQRRLQKQHEKHLQQTKEHDSAVKELEAYCKIRIEFVNTNQYNKNK